MLKEIYCEKFRRSPIVFHEGLNAVVGDAVATNSIGKTTLLLLVDFAMGGEDFTSIKSDVIDELGHHSYGFVFNFNGAHLYFRRDTSDSRSVFVCDKEWEVQEAVSVNDYRNILLGKYELDNLGLSFRGLISNCSRIWGKENLNPARPLDSHSKQSASDAITYILKIFGKYEILAELDSSLRKIKTQKDALRKAFKENIVPKIGKRQYQKNELLVEKTDNELEDIKENLAKYAMNIREITNREISEIKLERDSLLFAKANVEARLRRAQSSLRESKYIKSRSFESLKDFFPDIDDQRLELVEEFHSSIGKLLKDEIRKSEKELSEEQRRINLELSAQEERLSALLKDVENPSVVVDRVFELSTKKGTAERENDYYDKNSVISEREKEVKTTLEEERLNQLATVSSSINNEMKELSAQVYGQGAKSPFITFTKSNYQFDIFEDTGTGKAYSNLILFDWALFRKTLLPVLIHDSVLFKNIENEAVSNMISVYSTFKKQVFIAIDEVQKYGNSAQSFIEKSAVLSLSDSNVLYTKDWRK